MGVAAMHNGNAEQMSLSQAFERVVHLATVNSRLDFGQRIVERPVPWLVGSLLLGFMLGHPRGR